MKNPKEKSHFTSVLPSAILYLVVDNKEPIKTSKTRVFQIRGIWIMGSHEVVHVFQF